MMEIVNREVDKSITETNVIKAINAMLVCMLSEDKKNCKNCKSCKLVDSCCFLTDAVFIYKRIEENKSNIDLHE